MGSLPPAQRGIVDVEAGAEAPTPSPQRISLLGAGHCDLDERGELFARGLGRHFFQLQSEGVGEPLTEFDAQTLAVSTAAAAASVVASTAAAAASAAASTASTVAKWSRSRALSSGWHWRMTPWPASGSSTKREPGMYSWRAAQTAGSMRMSWPGQTMTVGMAARRSA